MAACLGFLNKVEENKLTERCFSLLGYFHEYKLIKPRGVSFRGSGCAPFPLGAAAPCYLSSLSPHTQPTLSSDLLQRVLFWRADFRSSARDVRSLLERDPFQNSKRSYWNAATLEQPSSCVPGTSSLLFHSHRDKLPRNHSPSHCPRTPSPPCVCCHRKHSSLAGEPLGLLHLSWINNYAPYAFFLGCYIKENRYSVEPFCFFSSERTYQSGCVSGVLTQGRRQ